jgi:hypothetical protein
VDATPEALIPEGLEPRPEPVEFEDTVPIAPGFVTRRGQYRNDRDQAFTLTAAALTRDADALRAFTNILRIWLVALDAGSLTRAEDAPEPDPDRPAGPDLESLVRTGDCCGDEPVLGLDVDLQCGDPEATYDIVGRVDTAIDSHEKRCFRGPERVVASGSNVKLGGLTAEKHVVDLPPSCDRDANRHCWVKGKHGGGNYSLNLGWYRVKCS